jgi:hypothetical protein
MASRRITLPGAARTIAKGLQDASEEGSAVESLRQRRRWFVSQAFGGVMAASHNPNRATVVVTHLCPNLRLQYLQPLPNKNLHQNQNLHQ